MWGGIAKFAAARALAVVKRAQTVNIGMAAVASFRKNVVPAHAAGLGPAVSAARQLTTTVGSDTPLSFAKRVQIMNSLKHAVGDCGIEPRRFAMQRVAGYKSATCKKRFKATKNGYKFLSAGRKHGMRKHNRDRNRAKGKARILDASHPRFKSLRRMLAFHSL